MFLFCKNKKKFDVKKYDFVYCNFYVYYSDTFTQSDLSLRLKISFTFIFSIGKVLKIERKKKNNNKNQLTHCQGKLSN